MLKYENFMLFKFEIFKRLTEFNNRVQSYHVK